MYILTDTHHYDRHITFHYGTKNWNRATPTHVNDTSVI